MVFAYDPSYERDESNLIVINRMKLLEFLKSKDLEIFWIIYGNKHITGTNFSENKDIRYDINGFFWLDKDKDKINGNFHLKEIFSNNLKELMEQYNEEVGKNVIWRGKLTKQFKKWYFKTTNNIL